MKKFLVKLLIFSSPILVLMIPPVIILIESGENYTSIDAIIEQDKPYLIGYAYNEENYKYLKWKNIDSKKKFDVLALGSSRVLQFRSQMFEQSFYNAGYTISSIKDFVPFLESIDEKKLPNYLIVSLDQWMFNENWDNLKKKSNTDEWQNAFQKIPKVKVLTNVWKDLLNSKYGFKLPKSSDGINRIGLNAVINNKGFRNDGSMYYGDQIAKLLANDPTANDYNNADTYDRIKKGNRRFEFGDRINPQALLELEKLLIYCKKKKIQLVAIIPTFSEKTNQRMFESGNYAYLNSIYPSCKRLFTQYNFEVYDFSSPKTVGTTDKEMIDGMHGGELNYLKMLIKMLASNSVLNKVANLNKLKEQLNLKKNSLEVY